MGLKKLNENCCKNNVNTSIKLICLSFEKLLPIKFYDLPNNYFTFEFIVCGLSYSYYF